jgi:hypothetical protein
VTPADRLDPIADQLKRVVDEAELRKRVVDGNTKLHYHGAYIPEIITEDLQIRKPSDYVTGAKSVMVMGMYYPPELIRNAGLEKSQQVGCYNFHQYQTCFELRFAALELATTLTKIGSTTCAPIPQGTITIESIAAACKEKDPIMKSRTCILEPCLRQCPAGRAQ